MHFTEEEQRFISDHEIIRVEDIQNKTIGELSEMMHRISDFCHYNCFAKNKDFPQTLTRSLLKIQEGEDSFAVIPLAANEPILDTTKQ